MLIPTTIRGRIVLDRRAMPQRDGLVGLSQTFTGSDCRTLVTHGAFVLARVTVLEGKLSFPLHSGTILAPDRFLLVVPPRSVLPMAFDRARVESEGVAGFSLMIKDVASLMAYNDDGRPLDLNAVHRAADAPVLTRLDADADVGPAIVNARALLHTLLDDPAPLRSAATSVGLRPETLLRTFWRAYRITPKQYCHRARLFEAVLRLMSGETILDAAFAAGFQDVKRFYAQFKRLLGTTPGSYAQIKKRQDNVARDRV